MAYVSSNGRVEMNRGDSLTLCLPLNIGTNIEPNKYKMTEEDAVYFGIMEPNQPFECALIKKKLTVVDQDDSGNILINLCPDDTVCVLPGKYYYQVKLVIHPDRVITIVDKTHFFILE